MKHELQILTTIFPRIADGSMTFLVQDNDHGFQPGDTVELKEWDNTFITVTDKTAPKGYTESKPLNFKVGYVMVLDSSRVIFSLLPLAKKKK